MTTVPTAFSVMALRPEDARSDEIMDQLMNALPIIIPDYLIRNAFTKLISPIFGMTAILEEQITILRRTRDLLLPRLMSVRLSATSAEAAVP